MVVTIPEFTSAGNKSNKGEQPHSTYENNGPIVKPNNIREGYGSEINLEPDKSVKSTEVAKYIKTDEIAADKTCYLLNGYTSPRNYGTFSTEEIIPSNKDADSNLDIVIYFDKVKKDVGVLIIPYVASVNDIENEQRLVLATSFQVDREANERAMRVKEAQENKNENADTPEEEKVEWKGNQTNNFKDSKAQTKETNINNNENLSTPQIATSESVHYPRRNVDDCRTPKRVHFQSPKPRTPRSVHKAHKIDSDDPKHRRCVHSRSSESLNNRNTPKTTGSKDGNSENRSIPRINRGQLHQSDSPTTNYKNKYKKDVDDADKVTTTQQEHRRGRNVPYKDRNSPSKKPYSSRTEKARYPERQVIILKKGQDITSALADRENQENLKAEKEKMQAPKLTILKPDQSSIPENERKQMRRSVQISKSQNSIKPVDSSKDGSYRSKSTVSVKDRPDNVFDEKSRKQRRNRKKNKKAPRTQIELFQRLIETGQLRSKFSRYKTEGLKGLQLVEVIHKGTFAVQYKARYQNKQVVVSVYYDQDVSDIDDIEMTRLGSNCYFILGINDCIAGPHGSLWFMTIYQTLGDLQKLLSRDLHRHVIGEKHAQFITAGVLIGVDFLHNKDIIHGNIKPSKVLINSLGFPVLTGFLKVHEDPQSDPRDVYTPAYAAPERYRGHRGKAVDIFSIGCMAYEIVTGSTPFDGGSLEETKTNILKHDVRPLYEPDLFTLAGEFFIDSCLCKSPKERFSIGEERLNMLREEWFSTLDWREFKRQTSKSPILEAIQLIDNRATLQWDEKAVDYPWGRVMDIVCPDRPTLEALEDQG